ncbi:MULTISPECIES: hypothetical protein [unclassified Legionella]|uniref:hypothetical protein n=1 Tax=unclassified Legionella TaxID=2622702 RepID=UPI003AF4F892
MRKKYYAVIVDEKESGDHCLKPFDKKADADKVAQQLQGKLYEYDWPDLGHPQYLGGKLIKDYSINSDC